MKYACASILSVFVWLAAGVAVAVEGDAILGTWLTEDKDGNRDSIVAIVKRGDQYVGTVVWSKFEVYPQYDAKGMSGQPVVDRENPDPSLRKRPILGLQVLNGLRFEDDEWIGGQIYTPRKGKSYSAKAWLEDDDTLKIRGYIGTPLLGRTVTWLRTEVSARSGGFDADWLRATRESPE